MQWFVPTTDELRERIEKLYQLDAALRQLANLQSEVDNITDRIEKDLRPTKVQHEMRIRDLEPLIDQIDEHTLRLKKLEETSGDSKSLSNDVSSAFGILRKNKTEIDELRAALKEVQSSKATNDDIKQLKAEMTILKRMKNELDGLKNVKSEIEEVRGLIPEPKPEFPLEEYAMNLQSKLEKIFKAVQADMNSEIEKLKTEVSNQPTAEQLLEKLQPQFEESKAEFEKIRQTLAQIQLSQSEQNSDFNDQKQQFVSQTEAKDEEIKQLWQLFSERIENKEKEIQELRKQADELKAELDIKDTAIRELSNHFEIMSKRLAELETKMLAPPPSRPPKSERQKTPPPSSEIPSEPSEATIEKPIEKPVEKPLEKPTVKAKTVPIKILPFEISARNGAYLIGTPEQIIAKINEAANVEELKKFLETTKGANNVIFLRSLDRHARNLQKFVEKLDFSEYTSGNASEEITKKFFEIFKMTLIDSVTSMSYRGIGRNPEFYREFLGQFNRYLSRCGIYTRRVMPGDQVSARDLVDMKITYREIKDPAKKNLIVEVERLPYYIDYVASTGETKNFFSEGRMTVYG